LLSDAKDGFEDDISVLDDDKDFELIVVDEEEEDATTEAIVVTNEELEDLEDGVVVEVAFCIIKLS
jgi:archaeosine-15-forming tRNA-guanine transglycosylase